MDLQLQEFWFRWAEDPPEIQMSRVKLYPHGHLESL